MVRLVSAVLFAISLACLAEYLTADLTVVRILNERYSSYAEIFAAILPVLVAYSLKAEPKWSRLSLLTAVTLWAAILATTSRAVFLSGIIGLLIFVLLSRAVRSSFEKPRRWLVIFTSLAFITVGFLMLGGSSESSTVVQRLSGNEEWSARSARSRLLFWGLAIEGFRGSPIVGIGADNYFSAYKKLREDLSTRNPENPVLEITEDAVPERAHNEYLQILAELGSVGILLFAWLILGIAYMFYVAWRERASLLATGTLAGIVAFLVSSSASSYSFRFAGSGMCFFFLLAVAVSELFGCKSHNQRSVPTRFSRIYPVVGILLSVAMIVFSLIRADSIRHFTSALNSNDWSTTTFEIEKALEIDPSEPAFHLHFGQWLYLRGEYDRAIPHLRFGIDNGLASSPSYLCLAASQLRKGGDHEAEETFKESLMVYPRSIFLRTAYSGFLKRSGRASEAATEFEQAFRINERQARSWQLAHDEGLERLAQVARSDDRYVSTFELRPESAPLTLAQFQETRR